MQTNNIISLERAHEQINQSLDDSNPAKTITLQFVKWINDWNATLVNDNHIFAYTRDINNENVAYAINRDENTSKVKKPNFLVIKLPGSDREFESFHFDFFLGNDGFNPLSRLLVHRSRHEHRTRWVVPQDNLEVVNLTDLKELCIWSFGQRGGRIS